MSVTGVDWEALGNPVPIANIPSEKELRCEIFKKMDVNNNGWLNLTEVMAGLPPLLEPKSRLTGEKSEYVVPLEDLKPAIKRAYRMGQHVAPPGDGRRARRAADCIDRREFHALLYAFRIHVELDVLFEQIDKDEDRRLHWKDVEKFVDKLAVWNISPEQARKKFPDDWTPSMSFEKFAEWCILRTFHGGLPLELDDNDPEATFKDAAGGGSLGGILEAFKDADTDGNQKISRSELARVLLALDDSFTEADVDTLFEAADTNGDGDIDYIEFADFITRDGGDK